MNEEILQALIDTPNAGQGAVGTIPSEWFTNVTGGNFPGLPNHQLAREELVQICSAPNVNLRIAYMCVMAWGGQENGPRGKKNAFNSWTNVDKIVEKIDIIRNGNLSRAEMYNLFAVDRIPGLGPAFFTKLICFFDPNQSSYIMDQWTTKSVLLLFENNFIKNSKGLPNRNNKGDNYELFCRAIDSLVGITNSNNGSHVEQRMFSNGQFHGNQRGVFRQLIVDQWENCDLPRYSNQNVQDLIRDPEYFCNQLP